MEMINMIIGKLLFKDVSLLVIKLIHKIGVKKVKDKRGGDKMNYKMNWMDEDSLRTMLMGEGVFDE